METQLHLLSAQVTTNPGLACKCHMTKTGVVKWLPREMDKNWLILLLDSVKTQYLSECHVLTCRGA